MRQVTTVNELPGTPQRRHREGFPPEVTGGRDSSKELPLPDVIFTVCADGGVLLYCFTWDGVFVGDTWHLNLEDAKHQAVFDYTSEALDEWVEVPEDIPDEAKAVIAFAAATFHINGEPL